jgi:5'-nucleotidase
MYRRLAAALAITTLVGASADPVAASNDNRRGPARITIVPGATAPEASGALSFTLQLSKPAGRWGEWVLVEARGGAATAGQDFRQGWYLGFVPGRGTTANVIVPIIDDTIDEPDETVRLRIVASSARFDRVWVDGTITDDDTMTMNIVHINDHHSHLVPDAASLNFGTAGGAFNTTFGGFPAVISKIDELRAALPNTVTIHAGDAITGTLYYSLFKGEADAAMMNEVCFDIFELGNHEFDDSDANLAGFLDRLNASDCGTVTLGANVRPAIGTPLAPTAQDDYIQPYVIKDVGGQRVGFIGLDIAQKTKVSSQPLPSTEFLDEVDTAQFYVAELQAQGIENIVLVTHYTYANDLALAGQVSGIDAIIGGDSHSLLGDFAAYGLASEGPYPTNVTNADGDPVCVVQAWQYSWVVGQLGITFDQGKNIGCDGTPHLLVGSTYTRTVNNATGPVPADEAAQIRSIIDAAPQLSTAVADPAAQTILDTYTAQVTELSKRQIGTVSEPLCLRRVPDRPRTGSPACSSGTPADAVSASGARLSVNGGFVQQVVTDAFLARSFDAEIAMQNAGGVRVEVASGNLTVGNAYTLLPFSNTLVNLDVTGAEIKQVLEEAATNFLNNGGSDGSYPYASALRWTFTKSAAAGNRFSNLEVRQADGTWAPIDLARTYRVVTNSFLAGGGDGWFTFRTARDDGRATDTFLNYAQTFIDWVEQDAGGVVTVPAPSDFSTQVFNP